MECISFHPESGTFSRERTDTSDTFRVVSSGFAPTLADAGEHFLTQGHPIRGCFSPESVWMPQLAVLKMGLRTHTPALKSIQPPRKNSKKCWAGRLKPQKSGLSQHFPPHTQQISRSNSSKTAQNSFKEILEVSEVHPDQQGDKLGCHRGELRQHLIKWNCSSPVQLLNVSLGRGSCSALWVLSHLTPNPCRSPVHEQMLQQDHTPPAWHSQPRSQGISESWQIDAFCIF